MADSETIPESSNQRLKFVSVLSRLDDPCPSNNWAPLERLNVLTICRGDLNHWPQAGRPEGPPNPIFGKITHALKIEAFMLQDMIKLLRQTWDISRPVEELALVCDLPSQPLFTARDAGTFATLSRLGQTESERRSIAVPITHEAGWRNLLAHLNVTRFFMRETRASTIFLRLKLVPKASLVAHKVAIESAWDQAADSAAASSADALSRPTAKDAPNEESAGASTPDGDLPQTPRPTQTPALDAFGLLRSAVQEAMGSSPQVSGTAPSRRATSGTEAGQLIANIFEGLLGIGPQSSTHTSAPAATPSTSQAGNHHADEHSSEDTHIPDPPEEQPPMLSDFERIMARSRAQGEALNQFFGAVTARRAGRPSDVGEAELSGTDTPPANPLRETPIKETLSQPATEQFGNTLPQTATPSAARSGRDADEASTQTPAPAAAAGPDTASDQVAAQNNLLASLWEQRLGEIGHEAGSQRGPRIARPVAPAAGRDNNNAASSEVPGPSGQKPSSSPPGSPWTELKSGTTSEAGSVDHGESHFDGAQSPTAGPSGAQAGSQSTQASATPVPRPTVEDSNDALADAFAEMLARARGDAK